MAVGHVAACPGGAIGKVYLKGYDNMGAFAVVVIILLAGVLLTIQCMMQACCECALPDDRHPFGELLWW